MGRKVAGRFRAKDAETGFKAAREEAAVVAAAKPKPMPTATSAAVDRTTGRLVGIGHARDPVDIPESLASRLPAESLTDWSTTNCAEVSAASKAIRAGSKLEDLVITTVRTKTGDVYPPCPNCVTWVPEGA